MVHAFTNSTLSTVDVQPALILRTIPRQVSDFIADETLGKRKVRIRLRAISQRVLAAAAVVTNLLPSATVRIAAVVVATVSQRVPGSSASETDQLILEYAAIRRRRLCISFVSISATATAAARIRCVVVVVVATSALPAVLLSLFSRSRRHSQCAAKARFYMCFNTVKTFRAFFVKEKMQNINTRCLSVLQVL
jgi:hypothetical protein